LWLRTSGIGGTNTGVAWLRGCVVAVSVHKMADDIPSSQPRGCGSSTRYDELRGRDEADRSMRTIHEFELATSRWLSDGELSDNNRGRDALLVGDAEVPAAGVAVSKHDVVRTGGNSRGRDVEVRMVYLCVT